MDVGLSRDGCIPRWDVGEPRGEDVKCPDESGRKKTKTKRAIGNNSGLDVAVTFHDFHCKFQITTSS